MLSRDLPLRPDTPIPGKLRALVVEDEWPARNYLVELLEGSGRIEVVGAAGDMEQAQAILGSRERIDVAFVDVQLGGIRNQAGLDLVRMFHHNGSPLFVLATAFRQHALEAFELGVVDYLLKPFSEERVEQCLHRLWSRELARSTDRSEPRRIVARRKRNLIFLQIEEVWAFEAKERLTFVHSVHGTFDVDFSLAAVEASFGRTFARVHRAWLVNLEFVRELERQEGDVALLVGAVGHGVRVPVARERTTSLRHELLANAAGVRRI